MSYKYEHKYNKNANYLYNSLKIFNRFLNKGNKRNNVKLEHYHKSVCLFLKH